MRPLPFTPSSRPPLPSPSSVSAPNPGAWRSVEEARLYSTGGRFSARAPAGRSSGRWGALGGLALSSGRCQLQVAPLLSPPWLLPPSSRHPHSDRQQPGLVSRAPPEVAHTLTSPSCLPSDGFAFRRTPRLPCVLLMALCLRPAWRRLPSRQQLWQPPPFPPSLRVFPVLGGEPAVGEASAGRRHNESLFF